MITLSTKPRFTGKLSDLNGLTVKELIDTNLKVAKWCWRAWKWYEIADYDMKDYFLQVVKQGDGFRKIGVKYEGRRY